MILVTSLTWSRPNETSQTTMTCIRQFSAIYFFYYHGDRIFTSICGNYLSNPVFPASFVKNQCLPTAYSCLVCNRKFNDTIFLGAARRRVFKDADVFCWIRLWSNHRPREN